MAREFPIHEKRREGRVSHRQVVEHQDVLLDIEVHNKSCMEDKYQPRKGYSDSDKNIIKEARSIPSSRWYEISHLMDEVSSDDTRDSLKWIMTEKRLRDERIN